VPGMANVILIGSDGCSRLTSSPRPGPNAEVPKFVEPDFSSSGRLQVFRRQIQGRVARIRSKSYAPLTTPRTSFSGAMTENWPPGRATRSMSGARRSRRDLCDRISRGIATLLGQRRPGAPGHLTRSRHAKSVAVAAGSTDLAQWPSTGATRQSLRLSL
jgi:hypothetical protein